MDTETDPLATAGIWKRVRFYYHYYKFCCKGHLPLCAARMANFVVFKPDVVAAQKCIC